MGTLTVNQNKLQKRLRRLAGEAVADFNMIEDGDKVMVCLSGGKDSYTMLDVLLHLQKVAPIKFEIVAVNMDQKQPGFPEHVLPEYLKAREEKPAAIMCTLEILDHTSKSGIKRYPTGGNEPILTKTGERIVDAKGRVSRVTTAGMGPSLGKYLLLAYLTPEHAVEGNELRVMYMNELFPVKVARVGSQPLFDPTDARMKS